jgi:hypothetical protein
MIARVSGGIRDNSCLAQDRGHTNETLIDRDPPRHIDWPLALDRPREQLIAARQNLQDRRHRVAHQPVQRGRRSFKQIVE